MKELIIGITLLTLGIIFFFWNIKKSNSRDRTPMTETGKSLDFQEYIISIALIIFGSIYIMKYF